MSVMLPDRGNAGEGRPSDGAEPSTPIMSLAAEPPPKKRKLVDAHAPSPSSTPAPAPAPSPSPAPPPPAAPPETLAAAAPSASAPPPETTSLSAEELLQKRRNREELCRLYECHRRIRNCLASKDPALLPQLEQDYLLLISSSRGSASAQRFLSLLIPRFSSYCPTALEAAAKVSINMYKSSIDIVTKGEGGNGFACQTARACIVGLTDICSAASSEAPKSPVLTGICSAVYMTVLAFFVSTFDRKDIYHIGSRKLSVLQDPVKLLETLKELKDTNLPELDYLFELRALCLLCTFLLFPENVLEANFALLASGDTDDVKGGLYFLNQLTSCLNIDVANDALDDKTDGQCSGVERDMPDAQNIVDPQPSSDDNVLLKNSMVESNECYMTMAMSRHPSLRRWIFSRYKKLCDSGEPDVVSEVSPCLKVLGSLSELAEDSSHMDTEPSVLENLDKNIRENMQSDKVISSSEQELLSKNDSIDTNVEKSSQVKDVDMDCTDDKISQKLTDAKIDSSKGASVVSVAAHKGMKPDLLTPKSTYDSPGEHLGKAKHVHSKTFDIYGASVSRDVISVSKELWVGSLGNRAAEALVRSKFEEFGPLGNLLVYPSKDFALVEYRNPIHAVRACGNMQGSSIWGGCLRIRYLDRLLGCQGFVGGVAIGESRHIYVANVKNQKDKDEVFDQLKAAGLKRPCGITDISSENALLLEFETAVDAATAKVYIRRQAHADFCSKDNAIGHQLLVQNIDNSVPDMELINAFARYGEVIRWQFNKPNGSCLIIYRSHDAAANAKSQLHGARFGMKSITIELRTGTAGSFPDKTVSSSAPMLGQGVPDNSIHHDIRQAYLLTLTVTLWMKRFAVAGDRPVYGKSSPSPPNTKQVWQHKDMESNRAPQVLPCPPLSTHRGSVMPPPPIQTSFVRPVYPGPGSPWENTTPNPPFSHVSPRMMPGSNFRVNPSGPLPFRPSSVAPLAQVPGSSAQHPETMPPPPPLTNSAPPPFTPLDRPPLPPPLPISQPPSVPPPPSSPPPLQSTADSSDLKKSCSHPRWQGSLSKSGLHYCRIYASRVELDACKYENAVSEPAEWPSKLDVTKRTDFQHVKTNFSNSPPSKREVCRLLPCSNGDQKGLRDFISYLKQRECAGVIKIPPVKPMWSRLLFILPPTAEACGMLGLPPHSADCLIALIVPKETTVEAA
ncbi:hypothetical protein EJB05_16876, partial [Eragrostis curvula]